MYIFALFSVFRFRLCSARSHAAKIRDEQLASAASGGEQARHHWVDLDTRDERTVYDDVALSAHSLAAASAATTTSNATTAFGATNPPVPAALNYGFDD